jgi:hypothetical protein
MYYLSVTESINDQDYLRKEHSDGTAALIDAAELGTVATVRYIYFTLLH